MLFVALLSLILLKLPFTLIQGNILIRILCFSPFCFYIVVSATNMLLSTNSSKKYYKSINIVFSIIFSFFFALIIIAYLKSTASGIITNIKLISRVTELCIFIIFLFFLFIRERKTKLPIINKINNDNFLYNALCLYVSLNVILSFFISTSSRAISTYGTDFFGEAEMLSWLGISATRQIFPLAPGFNTFGSISGLALTASLVDIYILSKNNKKFFKSFVFMIMSVYSLLICDTRGAFFACLLTLLTLSTFIKLKKSHLLKFISFLPTIVLVFLVGIIEVLNNLNITSLARSSGDILTGRGTLWISSIEQLRNPAYQHFIGYGMHGQTISGLSQLYSDQFEGLLGDKAELASLHNTNLQYIFDIGYIGLILLILIFFFSINFYVRKIQSEINIDYARHNYINISMLVFFVFIGLFEVIPTVYNPDVFFVFLCLITRVLFYSRIVGRQKDNFSILISERSR